MTATWPSSDIHTMFGPDLTPAGGVDWKQIQAFARFALESFVGRIAIAFGGIDILGWKPFDFLVDWGQARVDEATANYLAALNAQSSANYANAQLAAVLGSQLASDVSGGVAVSALYNGPQSNTLPGFHREAVGPGAGTYGPSGAGTAKWSISGGAARMLVDRHPTPLATDYQVAQLIMASRPQAPDIFGGQAYNWACARMNTAQDTFLYARPGYNSLKVGCYVSGVDAAMPTAGSTPQQISLTIDPGDILRLIAGTDVDDYEFIVIRNGVIAWRDIDHTHVSRMGASYRSVGQAQASNGRLFFTQTVPGETFGFAAADRLPASY